MATYMDVDRVIYSSPPPPAAGPAAPAAGSSAPDAGPIVPTPDAPETGTPLGPSGASAGAGVGARGLAKGGGGGTASGPLCQLYFCRHCLKLRSSSCVSHEVDSHYCPNCLEGMASGEAKMKKNRCNGCFDCPSCQHTLSTRATSVPSAGELDQDGRPVTRKAFYLACGFCRWTSRDVGIPDQPVSSGGWRDQENIHEKRIGALLEYYRQLAQREKTEREKKRFTRRKGFYQLSIDESTMSPEKFGLNTSSARKRTGLMGNLSKDMENVLIQDVGAGVASEVADELDESFYTQPLVLAHVTSITQRHGTPEFQPTAADKLYPRHKQLLVKRSQRCKECDHNVSKPEYNPNSIKFKIQLVAILHVPEIRIMALPHLKLNQPSQVILTIINPLDFLCHATLLPRDPDSDPWTNAKLELPVCELLLARCDESAEFDDSIVEQQSFEDDLSVVVFRKANKIGFFITVTPLVDNDEVKVSFRLKHDYQTMGSALPTDRDLSGSEFIWLEHIVSLNLGRVASN